MRRDIVSAYLVTVSRVAAWYVVIAAVFRTAGSPAFAVLALVQSTVGLLEYTAVGLGPAIIRMTAEALRLETAHRQVTVAMESSADAMSLQYASPAMERAGVRAVFANGFALACLTAAFAATVLCVWQFGFPLHHPPDEITRTGRELIVFVGIATILRMLSDAPGAALQTSQRIFADNCFLASAELTWAIVTVAGLLLHLPWQRDTGAGLILGAMVLLAGRSILSHRHGSGIFDHWWEFIDRSILRKLFIYGLLVVAAQVADYLYAPTDYILIANLINKETVAIYAPAVQIDGGMLLLVGAVASVLLPHTALAHAAGGAATVRRYYVRGTLATAAILLIAAPIVWLAAPLVFKVWLGNPLPATCKILTLMLIHTVVGGTSAVGRSILLATGKARPFTVAVLIAGVANVILSFVFVHYFHWGLNGIVLGTIVAVTGRCMFWLPWYVMRSLRKPDVAVE